MRRAKALTEMEALILRKSPYDDGGTRWRSSPAARQLVRDGLLEENPTGRYHYRITHAGERVLEHRRFLDRVRGLRSVAT